MRKNSDELIQQVLAGLRNSEASAGMECRILDAIRDRASTRSAARWRGLRPMESDRLAYLRAVRPLAWGLALGGISVLSAVFVIHQTGRAPVRTHVQVTRAASLPATHSRQVAEGARTRPSAPFAPPGRNTAALKRLHTSASDLAILRDMRAASHPAPEAPLTKQEKILLRIAHTGDTEELTMLNPEMRARQQAEIEAEFQRFAAQSSQPDQE